MTIMLITAQYVQKININYAKWHGGEYSKLKNALISCFNIMNVTATKYKQILKIMKF